MKNAAEYALGTAPLSPDAAPAAFRLNDGGAEYPAITFRRRTGAGDLTIRVQISSDLATWNDNSAGAFTTEISATPAEDGMEIATVRSNTPLSAAKQFLRVKVELPQPFSPPQHRPDAGYGPAFTGFGAVRNSESFFSASPSPPASSSMILRAPSAPRPCGKRRRYSRAAAIARGRS